MKNLKALIRCVSAVCLMFVCSVLFTVYTQAATEGIFTYTVNNNEATITEINDRNLSEIQIPETLGGYTVTTLEGNLTSAFYASGKEIFATVYIPSTVKKIDTAAFYSGCVERFVVDENNAYFSSDESGVLFNKDKTVLHRVPNELRAESFTVPQGVTEIFNKAFANCSYTSVELPDSLKTIDEQAFVFCRKLKSIDIPDSVTTVAGNAFFYCTTIESVRLSSNLTTLGNGAFSECYKLKKIVIPEGIKILEKYTFENDQALEEVYLPSTLTEIRSGVFGNCISLNDICYAGTREQWENITIDTGEYSSGRKVVIDEANIHYQIDVNAYDNIEFEYQNGVLSVNGEGALPSLGDSRWSYTKLISDGITTIILSSGITEIGDYSFEDYPALEEVIAKSDNITISPDAFNKCPKLRNVILFGGSSFGESSFTQCNPEINIYEDTKASHTLTESVGCINVIPFSFENSVLSFSGKAALSSYEFFDTIGGFCLKYDNIERVKFSSLAFDDIRLYYADENHMLVPVEENKLDNCEIYPSLTDSDEGAVSFNELIAAISDSSVEHFYLITSAQSHGDIDNPEIEIKDDAGKISEIILQALRWIVTLLNKLFALISKLR